VSDRRIEKQGKVPKVIETGLMRVGFSVQPFFDLMLLAFVASREARKPLDAAAALQSVLNAHVSFSTAALSSAEKRGNCKDP
jgi:hypothetical protein